MTKKVRKLPKKPRKGSKYSKVVKGKSGKRLITFKATGKSGFGKWKIIKNNPYNKITSSKLLLYGGLLVLSVLFIVIIIRTIGFF